ncbi:MAG: acetylglutamate kinase [Clostridiales bacterium]|nr:acetylglutamate kinase [Clostridiales bacterium]
MKISNEEKAGILVEALPYIQKYYNQIVVIKYGGKAMTSQESQRRVIKDLVLLKQIGIKVVLVHGAEIETAKMLDKMNIECQVVDGIQKLDNDAISVVQMALAGKVNKDLVNLIQISGANAIGLCGIDGHMIKAKPLSCKLGFQGDIESVDTKQIISALDAGLIPVIGSLGCDSQGNIYNINADTVAARISGELKAISLIVMGDTKGILKDKNDNESLVTQISVSEVPQLIKEKVMSGDMIAKAACCVEAIRRGVQKVFILDGGQSHAILVEILSDKGIGTMFV